MPALFNIDRKTTGSLIVAMLAVCALGTSCSEELGVEHFQQTDQMSFNVSISNKWNIAKTRSATQSGRTVTSTKIENSDLWLITTVEANPDTTLFERPKAETRATPYDPTGSSESLNPLDNFGVYAWVYTGEDWSNAQNKQLYINGDKVEPSESGNLWSTENARFWPDDAYKMRFFAYAPHTLTNTQHNTRTINLNGGTPIIEYTTALNARNQEDLLVALDQPTKEGLLDLTQVDGGYKQPLGLEFRHILTAVNVRASDALGRTITSIKFTGIKQKGTYNHLDGSWTTESDSESEFVCDRLGSDGTGVNLAETTTETPADVIADGDGTTFMMIPQELGSNAKIEVTLSDGTKSKTLTAPLTGKWQAGARVTYIIEFEEANCYILKPTNRETIYKIPIKERINKFWKDLLGYTEPIDGKSGWTAEVIWQDYNQQIITFCDASGEDEKTTREYTGEAFYVKTIEKLKGNDGANVLVGIRKSGEPTYLWSWHLWITCYDPDDPATLPSIVEQDMGIMTRSLGALHEDDYWKDAGLYYQFGRKDPFPADDAEGTHVYGVNGQEKTLKYTSTKTYDPTKDKVIDQNIILAEGPTTISNAVQNPHTFYYFGNGNVDWVEEGKWSNKPWNNPFATSANDYSKGLFDPCPPGWKVPRNGTWERFKDTDTGKFDVIAIKDKKGLIRRYEIKNKGTKEKVASYPCIGARNHDQGTIRTVDVVMNSWSSTPCEADDGTRAANYFRIGGGGSEEHHLKIIVDHIERGDRGFGFPVRCVKDDKNR